MCKLKDLSVHSPVYIYIYIKNPVKVIWIFIYLVQSSFLRLVLLSYIWILLKLYYDLTGDTVTGTKLVMGTVRIDWNVWQIIFA